MKPILKPIQTQTDINAELERLLALDPGLVSIAEIAGELPLRLQAPGFAGLARIIIGQHVSTASASAIHGRFIDCVNPVDPEAWNETPLDTRVAIGLTRAKQATLDAVADACLAGELDFTTLGSKPAAEAIANLTAIKGIGPWTADVYLLFSEGHRDLFAAGDLAIREAVKLAFDMPERPSEKELRQLSRAWSPHRGVATRLFWTYYEKIKHSKRSVL